MNLSDLPAIIKMATSDTLCFFITPKDQNNVIIKVYNKGEKQEEIILPINKMVFLKELKNKIKEAK